MRRLLDAGPQSVLDGQAAEQRRAAAHAQERAELEEARRKVAYLTCTVRGHQDFDEQISREDSDSSRSRVMHGATTWAGATTGRWAPSEVG